MYPSLERSERLIPAILGLGPRSQCPKFMLLRVLPVQVIGAGCHLRTVKEAAYAAKCAAFDAELDWWLLDKSGAGGRVRDNDYGTKSRSL